MKILLLTLVAAAFAADNTTETTTAELPVIDTTTAEPVPVPDETTTAAVPVIDTTTPAAPVTTTPEPPAPEPVTTTTPAPEPVTTPAPVTTPQPEPVTTPQPEPVTTPQPEPEPVTTPQPEPVTTPQPEPAPVTTEEPTPAPVDNGIRVLANSNGTACIMVMFQAEVTLTASNETVSIFSNETAVDEENSKCVDEEDGTMTVTKGEATLVFKLAYTTTQEGVKNVTTWKIGAIDVKLGSMDTAVETLDLRAESIHGGSAYSCITGFTSNLTDPADVNSTIVGSLKMREFWVECGIEDTFPIEDETKFAKAESCAADIEESLLVPIVVACALAGLVLAICVAYIIGRRRTYSGYSRSEELV